MLYLLRLPSMRGTGDVEKGAKVLEPNSDLEFRMAGGLKWLVRPSLVTGMVEPLLADPEGPFSSGLPLLRNHRNTAVAMTGSLVVKCYNRSNFRAVKDWFRLSRARATFRKACRLEEAGILSPRGIAATERWRGPFFCKSYFIMEAVSDAAALRDWRGNETHPIESVARLVAQFHKEGFIHTDLNPGNILFDGSGRAYLIDLDGLSLAGKASSDRQTKELERLIRGWRKSPLFGDAECEEFHRLYGTFRFESGARALSSSGIMGRTE